MLAKLMDIVNIVSAIHENVTIVTMQMNKEDQTLHYSLYWPCGLKTSA